MVGKLPSDTAPNFELALDDRRIDLPASSPGAGSLRFYIL